MLHEITKTFLANVIDEKKCLNPNTVAVVEESSVIFQVFLSYMSYHFS